MMEENSNKEKNTGQGEFKGYAVKRITVGVLLTFAVLWIFGTLLGIFDSPEPLKTSTTHEDAGPARGHAKTVPETAAVVQKADISHGSQQTTPSKHAATAEDNTSIGHAAPSGHEATPAATDSHATGTHTAPSAAGHGPTTAGVDSHSAGSHGETAAATHEAGPQSKTAAASAHGEKSSATSSSHGEADSGHGAHTAAVSHDEPKGVAFINAAIRPLQYELEERFWGWRPNDILDFTDNVNHFQLGVLEVTRRTTVALTERISRTGSAAAFDKNLENAMNWFMIKAERYWFPSPESKYQAGLKELALYRDKLKKGNANFHTRTDNLIPLLKAYENLLGSCDENLVKEKEDDGSPVSFFQADDYFFYAKGVASAMHSVLESIHIDFSNIIESRRGEELLHHAILSCEHAMHTNPILITNSSMSGILANHRANLAASISHARFYIGMLIMTLST